MPIDQSEFFHETLNLPGRTLAYRQDGSVNPHLPSLLFLPGFCSDMTGSKAAFLAACAVESGRQLTRLDYSGHGFSSGQFIAGTIGDWLQDALAVLDQVTTGKQILVGSSMGGWIMLLLALQRPERVAGLVGIAAAPDFTETLIWEALSPMQRQEMREKGVLYEPSAYGAPLPYTLRLVEEGRKHLLLRKPIAIHCPVRLLHGMKDEDVPWQVATKLAAQLESTDVRVTLLKEGEHRLSSPEQLALLWQEANSILC